MLTSEDDEHVTFSTATPLTESLIVGPLHITNAQSRFMRELLGYTLASAAALAVDVSLLTFLVQITGWHYLPASIVAFVTGAWVAYGLSIHFVFRSHRIRNRSLELGCFVALGSAGLAVNSLTLFIAISKAGLGLLTAKMLGAGCTFATNFALRRQLLFTAPRSGT